MSVKNGQSLQIAESIQKLRAQLKAALFAADETGDEQCLEAAVAKLDEIEVDLLERNLIPLVETKYA